MLLCKCCCLLNAIRCIQFLSPLVNHITTWSTWGSSVCLPVLPLLPCCTCMRISLDAWRLTYQGVLNYGLFNRQATVCPSPEQCVRHAAEEYHGSVPGGCTNHIPGHPLLYLHYTLCCTNKQHNIVMIKKTVCRPLMEQEIADICY